MEIKGQKKIDYANINQKKPGNFIRVSDKIYFKMRNITKDIRTFHHNRVVSLAGRNHNPEYTCVWKTYSKIHKAKMDKIKRWNRWIQNYSGDTKTLSQYPIVKAN